MSEEASIGIRMTFWLGLVGELAKCFGVLLRDEIVERLHIAAADGCRNEFGRLGFRLGEAFAAFGFAIGSFALALGLEDLRLLQAFGAQYLRCPGAFGFKHNRTLVALRLHLTGHRVEQVFRRVDVLDLDAGHLDAPGVRCLVDNAQEAIIDRVAVRQEFVEDHRPHDGTDIGHGQVEDSILQPADLIGRLRRVKYLVECDAIDGDVGIVLGDDLLALERSSTCSIMFNLAPIRSKKGMIRLKPGARVRVYLPKRSMV